MGRGKWTWHASPTELRSLASPMANVLRARYRKTLATQCPGERLSADPTSPAPIAWPTAATAQLPAVPH